MKKFEDDYNKKGIMKPMRDRKYYLRNHRSFVMIALFVAVIVYLTNAFYIKEREKEEVWEATIIRVIDGDTVIVDFYGREESVRMIGVDAPESVSKDETENTIYGEYASQYTKNHLQEGMVVYLTFDVEKYDRYDRLLAYIWIGKDLNDINNLYQKKMVEDGYAVAIRYEPNVRYHSFLEECMDEAAAKECGLWGYEEYYNMNYNFVHEK